MIKGIKNVIVKIIERAVWGSLRSPEAFANKLRRQGIQIGEGTIFFDPRSTIVDAQNPKLIRIGDNVRVTAGCRILTHDFSWSVLGGVYGEVLGALGTVDIGNNVFIGMNTVILRNTKIGNNVIIGAGSVVSGVVESNSVYAGVPAKKMMSLEDFHIKRKKTIDSEIKKVISRIDLNNEEEVWKYLREYSCYFKDAPDNLRRQQMKDTGYYDKCEAYYKVKPPVYSLEDFK